MRGMKPYSEDLRRRIVVLALSKAGRLSPQLLASRGVSLSSVERYLRISQSGEHR